MAPPVFGKDFAAATVIRGEHVPRNDQTPVIVDVLLADEDMSVEEHEAIVVGDDIIEVGGPADVLSPVVGSNVAAATVIRGESNPRSDKTPVSVGISPVDEDISVEEHEAIVVGAILVWELPGS